MSADDLLLSEPTPVFRRTVVCRVDECGGGWWDEQPLHACPRCGKRLTELALTKVAGLGAVR